MIENIVVIFSVETIMGKLKLDFVMAQGELDGLTNFSITNLVTNVEQSTTDITLHYDSVFVSSKSDNLLHKVCTLENNTNFNSIFCLIKSSKIVFDFLPAFYLIMWLMKSPNNFEKIAILKT